MHRFAETCDNRRNCRNESILQKTPILGENVIENIFSPIFGGRPDCFFGRTDILNRFDLAMTDYGSEDRVIFLTGARGSGKTLAQGA